MSHDEFKVGITDDIIKGLLFFVDVAETNDALCYADENDQELMNKAGEWLAKVRQMLEENK